MGKEEQKKQTWSLAELSPSSLQGQEARGELGSLGEEPPKAKAAPAPVRAAAVKLGPVRKEARGRRAVGRWQQEPGKRNSCIPGL